jgi:hypothetical protein
MKVELNNVVLGMSALTETVFAGTLNKAGNMWLQKTDVSQSFMAVLFQFVDPKKIREISSGKEKNAFLNVDVKDKASIERAIKNLNVYLKKLEPKQIVETVKGADGDL